MLTPTMVCLLEGDEISLVEFMAFLFTKRSAQISANAMLRWTSTSNETGDGHKVFSFTRKRRSPN